MERADRITMWVVSLAVLLAGAAFSYAHLRQMDLWALKILAGSVWRVVAERFWAYDYRAARAACWAASVAPAVTMFVSDLANLEKRRRRVVPEAMRGNDHE